MEEINTIKDLSAALKKIKKRIEKLTKNRENINKELVSLKKTRDEYADKIYTQTKESLIDKLIAKIAKDGKDMFDEKIPDDIKNILKNLETDIHIFKDYKYCRTPSHQFSYKVKVGKDILKVKFTHYLYASNPAGLCYYKIKVHRAVRYFKYNPLRAIISWDTIPKLMRNKEHNDALLPGMLYLSLVNRYEWEISNNDCSDYQNYKKEHGYNTSDTDYDSDYQSSCGTCSDSDMEWTSSRKYNYDN
jgi:hypothetical protein